MKDNKTENKSVAVSAFEWVQTFCVALFFVVLIFTFLCRFVTVSGHSMRETLHNADRLIISNLFYEPEYGDIVVVHDANEPEFEGPVIKRVIATAGETVDIDPATWTVTVTDKDGNERVLKEDYINRVEGKSMAVAYDEVFYPDAITIDEFPHKVEEGCVFVMGDNRNASLDSRFVGDIDERKILGKAYVRLLPIWNFKFLG